ncbi:MAG: hypothetical protein HYX72_15485 [Acidobacteria bacterium]|nr:hypothetical protein [Acidobacteriota bacterium]
MTLMALLFLAVLLVAGGLVYGAIRRGREVDAQISHGRTVFKLKVK